MQLGVQNNDNVLLGLVSCGYFNADSNLFDFKINEFICILKDLKCFYSKNPLPFLN